MASITCAVGEFITRKTGIPSFADRDANTKYTYPCVEVALVGEPEPFLVLPGSYYEYDTTSGEPTFTVKEHKIRDSIRITVKSVMATDGSSERECVKNRDAIRTMFLDSIFGEGDCAISDSKDPGVDLGLIRMAVGMAIGPTSDLSGEPHLHTASLMITTDRREKIRRVVTQFIEGPIGLVPEVLHA